MRATPAPPRNNASALGNPVRGRRRALIIFGMQQDFFASLVIANPRTSQMHKTAGIGNHRPGALPVPGATEVASTLRQLLKLDFDAVIWCKTCHPINHCSFVENNPGSEVGTFEFMLLRSRYYQAKPFERTQSSSYDLGKTDSTNSTTTTMDRDQEEQRTKKHTHSQRKRLQQVIRPTHCVEGTRGANFHPDLRPAPRHKILKSSTSPQSQSPAVPESLISTLKNISNLGEIYFAGIGISSFVDTSASKLLRAMPSIHIYGLIDICRVLNIGDDGRVVETNVETLDSLLHRNKIKAMYSHTLLTSLKHRPLEGLTNLHWDEFVQALSTHVSRTNIALNQDILLELLRNRELHMHNRMPSQDWLARAGFWDHQVIDILHEISGENLLHAAARLGDIVFLQEMLGGRHTDALGNDQAKHIVPAKFRLHIRSAKDLPKSDLLGLSDPYVVIKIGPSDATFDEKTVVLTTDVKYKTLNPEWNARFEVSTDDLSATDAVLELEIRIFDKDQMSKDDLLGEIRIPITQRNCPEESYPLDNCKTDAYIDLSWQTMYTNNSLARQHDSHAEILMKSLTSEGNSPLTLAVANGHGAVASLLVRSGLATHEHINHRVAGDRGLTSLMYACLNGDRETIKLLLAFGAEPRAVSMSGTPTLLFCTFSPNQNYLDSFVTVIKSVSAHSRHAMLNQTDQCGWSCLHTMSRTSASGHVRWTTILPRTLNKVDINALTLDGLSVLHLASWNLSLNTLRLLLQVHKLVDRQQHKKQDVKKRTATKSSGNDVEAKQKHPTVALGFADELTEVLAQEKIAAKTAAAAAAAFGVKKNRFPVFLPKQLKTLCSKRHTALDLSIIRYLQEKNTTFYTRAFECILVLTSANFTASSSVGSACQRVFDRIMIAGDTAAVAGMLRSDANAINIRSHHVTLASGTTNYKHNACTFSMGSMEGRDQHMYYDRESRTQVCQVCRDLCFEEKAKKWSLQGTSSLNRSSSGNNNTVQVEGLTYLGFLEGGICECQQNSIGGHRCRAVDRTDEKALAIKLYVPTSVLVPPDIRDRTIKALDGLIRELAYAMHARGKINKERQGWTFGSKLSDDLQTDPKLAPFGKLSKEDALAFREEVITMVSIINYAGFNIIGPITMTEEKKVLPDDLHALSVFVGHDAHERWAENKVRKGWRYAPVWLMNAKGNGKLDSRLVPFKLLSEYHRQKWIHAGAERMVDILNFGYRIIAIDKMKLPQLVENQANIERAGLPINQNVVTMKSRRKTPVFDNIPKIKMTKLKEMAKGASYEIAKNRQRVQDLMGTLLLAASRWSLLSIVTDLLNKGANINKQDRFGYTPLMLAVKRDCTAVAKYLVDQGAHLEMRNIHHFTSLMLASYLGNTGMLKLLLKNGANILAIDHRRMMCIHHAAYMGHTKAVKLLGKEVLSAGYIVDICAPHDIDIAHMEHQMSSQHVANEMHKSHPKNNQVAYAAKDRQAAFGGGRDRGNLSFINHLKKSTTRVNRHFQNGLERIASIFKSAPSETKDRAQLLTGSLSRVVHSKRNLFCAYDKDLSGNGDQQIFNPHELLLDQSMAGIATVAMKRGVIEGLSPLALAVKASHLEVVQCLVDLGADPTAYDSSVYSPYERALIKSGEEEERIAASEASSEQTRILSKFLEVLKGLCSCCNCLFKHTKDGNRNGNNKKHSNLALQYQTHIKDETIKSRALLAGKIVEALNSSQSVVQERCLLGCRNWIKNLFVFTTLIVLLFHFSPAASDHPRRHVRINPLKHVINESITAAIGTGTTGAHAIQRWWSWHEEAFFNDNAHFVAVGSPNASYATVYQSKDFSFVGGLLLLQQRYTVGQNEIDCGMDNLKVCHTGADNGKLSTRPLLSNTEHALDASVSAWDGNTNIVVENIQVKPYASKDTIIPPFVALSLVKRHQSLSTLSQMKNISWANEETRVLFTKFSVYHQTTGDAYYCHVDVRVDFPVTGGTSISVDVQEFTSPLLHWSIHRFAPSVFFLVFVATISLYHLFILIYTYVTVGWLRCVRSPRTWVESVMMGLMIVVGIMNNNAIESFNNILQRPMGSSNKYHALYKVANLVKVTNDAYSLAFTLIFIWNIIKVLPRAPIIGPKMSAILHTILAINQLVYLTFTIVICCVFSFRWNISLFGVESLFTTFDGHTKNSYFFAIFRIPFADEFSNAMDHEVPRREINTIMEVIFFVSILIITQNYIGVFVDNWDRENKRAESTWNEELDTELRRKGMVKYNSTGNAARRAKNEQKHSNLKKYLQPALLLIGDDGLVFSGDGSADNVHGAADREKRIDNAMRGTSTSITSINSSIDSMRNRIPEFKRDMMQALKSARKILAKAHTRKMASKVHRFITHSQSVNRGVLGLARAPPQGRAPPKPHIDKQIQMVQVKRNSVVLQEEQAAKLIEEERNKQMHTPEPPPRPPRLSNLDE